MTLLDQASISLMVAAISTFDIAPDPCRLASSTNRALVIPRIRESMMMKTSIMDKNEDICFLPVSRKKRA